MNKRTLVLFFGGVLVGLVLAGAVFVLSSATNVPQEQPSEVSTPWSGYGRMMETEGERDNVNPQPGFPGYGGMMSDPAYPYGYGGMMGVPYGYGGMMGYGMMGPGMMGPGMMGYGYGYGPGMMGFGFGGGEPLDVDEAREILEDFLARLGKENLTVREIMVFDNHTYAQILETDTGMGAFEVLIDPVTKAVYPEHGPTMMWNLKYSPMAGWMGFPFVGEDLPEPTIDEERALAIAQAYLDRFFPGSRAEEPVPFYGYYTLHISRDGQVVGMLSVHAYTGAVFPHFWHGQLVAMMEMEDASE